MGKIFLPRRRGFLFFLPHSGFRAVQKAADILGMTKHGKPPQSQSKTGILPGSSQEAENKSHGRNRNDGGKRDETGSFEQKIPEKPSQGRSKPENASRRLQCYSQKEKNSEGSSHPLAPPKMKPDRKVMPTNSRESHQGKKPGIGNPHETGRKYSEPPLYHIRQSHSYGRRLSQETPHVGSPDVSGSVIPDILSPEHTHQQKSGRKRSEKIAHEKTTEKLHIISSFA